MKQTILDKIKAMNFVDNYRKIWPYVRPYRMRALAALLITLPAGAMDASIALLLKPYMDAVMVGKSSEANKWMPIIIIAVSALQSGLNYASVYINTWVGQKVTMNLKADLFKKLLNNEVSFFDKSTSGDIQFRFNTDAELACNGLLNNLKTVTTQIFSSVSLVAVLIYNSWQLALIAICALAIALYPLSQVRRKIKELMGKTVFSGGRIITHYNEAFSGNRVIASYNLHKMQESKFQETLSMLFHLGMKMTQRTGMLSPMMHFITSFGIAAVVWLGGYLILHDKLTPGGFVSFISALLMLYTPMKSLGNNITNLQMSFMAMERTFEVLERDSGIKNKPDAIMLGSVNRELEYKDVVFEYIPGVQVLKGVSLKIPVGKTIALVGNSGGGKTTFVNLLPRFYDITSGSITVDGVDIRDFNINSLRDKIGIVFQDNFLFGGTIRENITLGNDNVTQADIDLAVKSACLDEFINSLEQGLDTEIGERGVLLSGGQKQRVAIARAFIKNAPIVILDEATSALDNKSEKVVQDAIDNLMQNRTVFIIAHRLSTVRNADMIVVINNGEIVETGTHQELLEKDGSVYGMLYHTSLK